MSYELSFLAVSLFGPRLSRVGLRTCRYTPQEGSDQLDKEQHISRGAEAPAVLATGELLLVLTYTGHHFTSRGHWFATSYKVSESDYDWFGRGRTSGDAHSYDLSLKKGHVLGGVL